MDGRGDPLSRERLEREVRMTFFRSGGPGGQHRNKVETAVRLLHLPTGAVASAAERRSQAQNRELAFERLAAKLRARMERPTPRVASRPTRASKQRRLEHKRRAGEKKRNRRVAED